MPKTTRWTVRNMDQNTMDMLPEVQGTSGGLYRELLKEGNRVFFIAALIAAMAFGPIGLLLTLLNTKGKPF